eukprot:CAMPEP_0182437132 /NCGR_PEP_ID=MMETSP1167-20130531/84833_1 /TAXON_ID=2988 /ORGANISM="Mallomonas Sp, Strain CCMP3275" /LENGTH=248 /DNA_ID=CAMNT_0024629931 /DNA_START=130 /DNA_END=873 /DNA_ORIENTATION=-
MSAFSVSNNPKSEVNEPDDEDEGLSAETLQALKEFTLDLGMQCAEEEDILASVRDHFNIQDKEEIFNMEYTSEDGCRVVKYSCRGLKKELGQTLSSTGLTVWRACEHMCEYIFAHPEYIQNKSVCELGAGLGLLSILMDKMEVCNRIVATDGDDDTIELLLENVEENSCQIDVSKLWWGLHEGFLEMHERFDVVVAADVVYEEEQIVPLLETVMAIMIDSGEFLLSFARRNVPIDRVLHTARAFGLTW